MTALLEVDGLRVWYPLPRRRGTVRAVDDVSFAVEKGQTLGIVGESGSGKSTIARAILRIDNVATGSVRLEGTELLGLRAGALRPIRRRVQMVFQDPYASLDPRQTVGQAINEPLRVHAVVPTAQRRQRIIELLDLVGLPATAINRYPHEFSGGQRQRIAIARALAVNPDLIVCDEPVSALDVSVQAQIMNLLAQLQRELGVAYIFVAHDLAVVRHIAHRLAVMYLGRIVETGPAEVIYDAPAHPYTRALLSAAPVPDVKIERRRERTVLTGDLPSAADPPAGCAFHTRCPLRVQLGNPTECVTTRPSLTPVGDQHVACHFRMDNAC